MVVVRVMVTVTVPDPPVCMETIVSVTVVVPGLIVGLGIGGCFGGCLGGCFGGWLGGVGFNGFGSPSGKLGAGRQRLSRQMPP